MYFLEGTNCCKIIIMAIEDLKAQVSGFFVTAIIVNRVTYSRIKLHIFSNLCADFVQGQNWQALHKIGRLSYRHSTAA